MPRKHVLIILGFILVSQIPFINKPLTIDDPLFFWMGHQIANGGDPYLLEVNWFSSTQALWVYFSNPPALGYFIAIVAKIVGENVPATHAFFLLFSVLAAFSFYWLCKYYKITPLATLFLVSTPAFMVMATTLMPDIGLLSLYLLSLTAYLWGNRKRRASLLILAAFAAAIVPLMRYNGLSIIPLLLLDYVLNYRERWKVSIAVPMAGVAGFCLWNWYTEFHYGAQHFSTQMNYQSFEHGFFFSRLLDFILSNFSFLGGASIFPFCLIAFGIYRKHAWFVLGGSYALSAILYWVHLYEKTFYSIPNIILAIFLIGTFIYLTIQQLSITISKIKSSDTLPKNDIFMICWVMGTIVLHLSGIHTAVKYMLIATPPLIILFINEVEKHYSEKAIGGMIVATFLLGIYISYADLQFALLTKNMAQFTEQNLKNEDPTKIKFTGHWGYQYYMMKKGFTPYEYYADDLKKGEFLIDGGLIRHEEIHDHILPILEYVKDTIMSVPGPIKTMHHFTPGAEASFYSNMAHCFGILPYSISTGPVEQLAIFKVTEDATPREQLKE